METRARRGSLKRRINRVELLLMILMALVISLVSYFVIKNTFLRFYNEKGQDIVLTLAAQMDGDRLEECLAADNVTEQEYYQEMLHLMDVTKSNITDHTYLYMFVPGEDSWVYVMEGRSPQDDPALISSYGEIFEYGETEYTRMLPDARAKKPSTEIVLGEDYGYGRALSNWAPVLNSKGDLVSMIEIDYSLEAINRELAAYLSKLILSFMVCIALVLLIILQTIRSFVTSPLENLTGYVDSYEHGELNEEKIADFKSGDEIEWLATSFKDMTQRIETYIRDLTAVTAEKERIGAELNVAAQIQADMLPRIFPAFPERKEFDLYASRAPAKEVDGDFYDFFLIDDDHIGLVMADVSGKGVPALLFMVIAKTLIKNQAQLGKSPAEVLENVNEQLCEGNEAELFVTVWLAIIEISTGKGFAANAGHEHPVIRRADGKYELVVYRHSPAVATMEGMRFRQHAFELQPGDSLFVYTDGVPEATNANNELFGTDRMLEILNREIDATPRQLLENVRNGIDAFVGDAPQFDDITMMCFNYFGPEGDGKELTVDATDEKLAEVLAFVDAQLEAVDCPMKTKMQIDVAVEELFVNIAHYAYAPETGSATLRLQIREDPKTAILTFIDHGVPYNPLEKPDPDVTLPAEERQIGGLGIYMVKKSMDEMHYEYLDGQNILTIAKKLSD